jgi:beta-phosphoglucomutase-like phosphatase (HAD superfamily)
MIEAVIFDMDGLLIDSEPLWQEAEVEIYNKIGVPMTVEMAKTTMGMRLDEVVSHWHKRYPWESPSLETVADELTAMVIEMIRESGVAREGVYETIAICEAARLPMAIASSSTMTMIQAVITKLGIAKNIQVIRSAHDEDYGKPHPAVYISTAKDLGVHPNHCLVFEDSANGVLSAKAAKMQCIAVPEPEERSNKRFAIADAVLGSLKEFTPEMLKG